ncbi:MAG: archaeal proteasome endopeptidase complex subunit alpha [Candidatus Micrarchaeia archaeon]
MIYPNAQAYDRGTMFSPDGQLFQVEYAKAAVKKGATALGMVATDGVVIIADKNLEPLVVPKAFQKIYKIDSLIGATYSGIVSDGLHIIGSMRNKTQTHRMLYNETESVETLAREMSDEMQIATQYGGVRPYAVSILIGGINTEPMLFEIDPAATPVGYKADAIGAGKKIVTDLLIKEYKDSYSVADALPLGIDMIKKVHEGKMTAESVEASVITKSKGFSMLSVEEIEKYI